MSLYKVQHIISCQLGQTMSQSRPNEDMPVSTSFTNFNVTRQSRDTSPQGNLYIPRPPDNKHVGSIKPYKPKKLMSNSPLGHKDKSEDSKSRLDSKSISKCEQNNRKQFESCQPAKKKSSKELEQIYTELLDLKSEYKSLKQVYNTLLREKQQYAQEIHIKIEQNTHLTQENTKLKKDIEKLKNQIQFSEHQLERIKKECFKLLEIQNFKNKKLEETFQEKQLMIQYLRAQMGKDAPPPITNLSQNVFLQNTTPIFRNNEIAAKTFDQARSPSNPLSSLQEIFAISQADHDRSKILLSSISQNARNASNISQDSLSFCKQNQKPGAQHFESVIASPTKKFNKNESELPNCCTFEMKQIQTDKNPHTNKVTKKNLTIDTDQNDDYANLDMPSISTKKRSDVGKKKHKQTDDEKQISTRSLQKKMRKIDVQLPSSKTRKSRDKINLNYR